MPSQLAPGQLVTLKVTGNISFNDDAGIDSALADWLFGVSSGVAWDAWMPVFIYALNRNDVDAGLAFGISRKPNARAFPEGDVGTLIGVSPNNSPTSILVVSSGGPAEYEGVIATVVGATLMKKPSAEDDWTLADSQGGLGFGPSAILHATSMEYTMPPGTNGNQAGTNIGFLGGSSTLSFEPNHWTIYRLHPNGDVAVRTRNDSIEGFASAGKGVLWYLPYPSASNSQNIAFTCVGGIKGWGMAETQQGKDFAFVRKSNGYAISDTDLSSTNDFVEFGLRYTAFHP